MGILLKEQNSLWPKPKLRPLWQNACAKSTCTLSSEEGFPPFLQQLSVLAQLFMWNQWLTGSQPFSLELGKELWRQLLNFYFQSVWLTSIPQRLPLAWLRCQQHPLTQLWFGPIGHICAPVAMSASVSWLSGRAVSWVWRKTQRKASSGSAAIVRRQHPKASSYHACSPVYRSGSYLLNL